jgi:hypothetical protein
MRSFEQKAGSARINSRRIVMISGTERHLPEHRNGIRDACERAGFELRMMKKLPALHADSIQASLWLGRATEARPAKKIGRY